MQGNDLDTPTFYSFRANGFGDELGQRQWRPRQIGKWGIKLRKYLRSLMRWVACLLGLHFGVTWVLWPVGCERIQVPSILTTLLKMAWSSHYEHAWHVSACLVRHLSRLRHQFFIIILLQSLLDHSRVYTTVLLNNITNVSGCKRQRLSRSKTPLPEAKAVFQSPLYWFSGHIASTVLPAARDGSQAWERASGQDASCYITRRLCYRVYSIQRPLRTNLGPSLSNVVLFRWKTCNGKMKIC